MLPWLALVGIGLVAGIVYLVDIRSSVASAVSASEFRPGRIIDDGVFYNKNAMNANQIQLFLNQQIPNCDTWGTSPSEYGGGTRAQYAASVGWPAPPYACLNNYHENPLTGETSFEKGGGAFDGGISAAQIIYDAAQKYDINPQVLLTLLKKESAGPLTSDTWPLKSQYKYAMGYACPDSGPGYSADCDNSKAGFYKQIELAAWQLKYYKEHSNDYRYKIGWNDIQYSPDPACGTKQVYIENLATLSLYIYTPYTPNDASLANYPGQAPCGAYGNRNFFMFFNEWFGSSIILKSTTFIPDGNYTIVNPASGKAIDAANAGTADGTKTWLYTRNNTKAQSWQFVREADGFYTIKNIVSNKYLDVTGGSVMPTTKVQIWSGNASCAQRWAAVEVGGGISLISKCSGLALDITGGATVNTTPLQIYSYNSSNAQIWKLVSNDGPTIAEGFYRMNSASGLSLEPFGSNTARGTGIVIANEAAVETQYWQINRLSDGLYTVRNPKSGLYLDVVSEGRTDGTKVQTWSRHETCAQKWHFAKNLDESYSLLSACSGLSLDITNGAISVPDTTIQIWQSNNTTSQSWHMVPLVNIPPADYVISTTTGFALDARLGDKADGTLSQIWGQNGTAAQRWRVVDKGNGLYAVMNVNSGKYLDVANASSLPGATVHLWSGNDTCAQLWKITRNTNSTYSFLASCTTSNVLDVAGGSIRTAGTRVQAYTSNNSPAQMWVFDAP